MMTKLKPLSFYASIFVALVSMLVYTKIIHPPTQWAQNTHGSLLGEVYLQSEKDAFDYAKQAVAEGYSIWDEPSSNWELMHSTVDDKMSLEVEARRITEGSFATSNILLTRASGTIVGASADALYDYFISTEGLTLLDPSMNVTQASTYIQRFEKSKKVYLDIHESKNPLPVATDRYHLVLNGYYLNDKFFFCKSIVHDCSPYFTFENATTSAQQQQQQDERVRAVNTFYFHIQPTPNGSLVRMVNFVDFQMGSTMMNWLTAKGFFPGVYERIQEKFGAK